MSRLDEWDLEEERLRLLRLSAKVRRDHARAEGIDVDRIELLETLKQHRAAYLQLYTEAYRGWLLRLQEAHRRQLKELEAAISSLDSSGVDDFVHRPFTLSRPVNTVSDYDVVIQATTRSVEPTFFVKRSEYREFFLDQWRWKEALVAMHRSYTRDRAAGESSPVESVAHGIGVVFQDLTQD